MRILYLGLPLGALRLHAAGFSPRAACLGPLDLPGRRRARRLLGRRGALVLGRPDLSDPGVRRALEARRPDVLLSWFWPSRIPKWLLELPPRGAYGTHPSLLPRWRGPDPYFWAIRAGDPQTGVTLHRLAEEYDTGEVIACRRVPIEPQDDAWSLARRLDRPALELLVEHARRRAAGETAQGTPQDEAQATWAGAPTDEELAIDWNAPTAEVLRLVRAAAPEPGAGARLGATEVEVLRARRFGGEVPAALAPAEAMRTDRGVAVRTGDGAVLVERVRTADGRTLGGDDVWELLSAGRS